MIRYIQREYYWIPRIFGQDPETGTYAPLPPGGWQFVSDQDPNTIPFQPAVGLEQRALHLPLWFPRKVELIGAKVAWGTALSSPVNPDELTAYVDPGGIFFQTGNPHGAEANSNFTRVISLFQISATGQFLRTGFTIDPPILLNRDAGDLLEVKGGFSNAMSYIYVGFRYREALP